jgi:hypothetical protein
LSSQEPEDLSPSGLNAAANMIAPDLVGQESDTDRDVQNESVQAAAGYRDLDGDSSTSESSSEMDNQNPDDLSPAEEAAANSTVSSDLVGQEVEQDDDKDLEAKQSAAGYREPDGEPKSDQNNEMNSDSEVDSSVSQDGPDNMQNALNTLAPGRSHKQELEDEQQTSSTHETTRSNMAEIREKAHENFDPESYDDAQESVEDQEFDEGPNPAAKFKDPDT